MSLQKFLLSKVFYKHLAFVVLFLIAVAFAAIYGLSLYTHHEKSNPVPNFKGMNIDSVIQYCELNHLKWIVIDSVFVDDIEPLTIIDHIPDSGFHVKKNRTIYFTINATEPEKVSMPFLIDLSFRQATAVLERNNLVLGETSYEPDLAVGIVLKQMIAGEPIEMGEIINIGTAIDLVLGSGLSNESVLVPGFTGMNLDEVKQICNQMYLRIGLVYFDDNLDYFPADSIFPFVYKQNPPAIEGQRIRLGSSIDLWLTSDSLKLPVDTINTQFLDSLSEPDFSAYTGEIE